MMTSSARKIVCVRGRARTESSMRSRMCTSASAFKAASRIWRHSSKLASVSRKIIDGVKRVDVVAGQVRGKTMSNTEHSLRAKVA